MKAQVLTLWLCLLPFVGFSQQLTEILGRPAASSITINVSFDSKVDVYFEYGTNKGSLSLSTPVFTTTLDQPYETQITGLLPATRYYYRTRYRKTGSATYLASEIHTFITQRKSSSSFRFTVEADPHPYDKKGYWPLWDIALANQLKDTADFMIDMGDTFGDDHNPTTITSDEVKQLQLSCRNFFGKVCHSMPFFFCIGNHEGESGYYLLQTPPNNLAVYETLWRKLYYPNPFPDGFYSGSNTEESYNMGKAENYFAWEWGDALFVVLDMYRYASKSEKPQKWDFTIGKEQYDWFKQTLETSKAKYKFVFSHHILGQGRGGIELAKTFEWGGYEGSTYKFDSQRPGWGLPIHQLMQKNKVDIYFQGHDHIYVKQDLDSIVYQSVPMPSDSSYKIGVTDNGDAYLSGKQLGGSGHLRITVAPDSVTVDFVSALLPKDETPSLKNGQVVYSYSVKKKALQTSTLQTFQTEIPDWKIYPNPASQQATVHFNQPVDQELTLQIITLDGKIANQLKFNKSVAPLQTINFKLIDSTGNPIKTGLYIIKLISGKREISYRKIAIQ